MANFRRSVEPALITALGIEAVIDVAPGGVWNGVAPQGTKPPWVVFQFVSNNYEERAFATRMNNGIWLVKVVDQSPWPLAALDVDTQIDSALEDATLTISGFTQVLCRRESDFSMVEREGGVLFQHIGGHYRIWGDQD
tara:strand:+ start:1952 stop:2365 length:414 start_codon:yes stop_codon:yes gene_type:complete